jgi:hypothetical protein
MTTQQQESIVMEVQHLAKNLVGSCAQWLHTATNRRDETAGHELSAAADALYSWINDHTEIMGSDTGRPAFDEFVNEDFQSDMNNLWEHEAD